jgi:hypothetical protein
MSHSRIRSHPLVVRQIGVFIEIVDHLNETTGITAISKQMNAYPTWGLVERDGLAQKAMKVRNAVCCHENT